VSDSVLDNAQHAEEARTIAEKLSDPQSRRTMLRIAGGSCAVSAREK